MRQMIYKVLTLTLVLFLCACAQKPATWQEQYDLGVRYLSEGNYEEAIIAFTAAIEIDAGRENAYISLAEAYRMQGDYDRQMETLRRGYEETGSPKLEKYISAEELNALITDAGYTELYSGLYQAFASGGSAAAISAMQAYADMFLDPYQQNLPDAPDAADYLFDGQRFTAAEDGSGLLFLKRTQVYWGEVGDGVPNGRGTMLSLRTWYESGGIKCCLCSGTWEEGKIIGSAVVVDDYSLEYPGGFADSTLTVQCVFDENEVMQEASVAETVRRENDPEPHLFHYTAADGKLVQSDWTWISYPFGGGEYQIGCELHADCGAALCKREFGGEKYQNPFPLNGKWAKGELFCDDIGYRLGDD